MSELRERIAVELEKIRETKPNASTVEFDGVIYTKEGEVSGYVPHRTEPSSPAAESGDFLPIMEQIKAEQAAYQKHDQGKPRYALLPMDAVEDIVLVLNHGAKKYDDHNWSKCPNLTRYYDATMRHLAAWLRGEDIDPDSGLPHLAHAGCSLLFLSALAKRGGAKDDRP